MADEFDEKAAELLPHYGANHGIIAGAVCPCAFRDAVAQALREAKAQGFAEGVTKAVNATMPARHDLIQALILEGTK